MNINYIKCFEYLVESGTITENEISQISKEVFKSVESIDEFDEKTLEVIQKKCQEYVKKNKT